MCHGGEEPTGFSRASAERLAEAGYVALAVDSSGATERGDRLGDRTALSDLDGAQRYLSERSDVASVAIVGFGSAATHAYLFACHSRELAAAVAYQPALVYPALSSARPMQPLEMALNLSCPLLAFFGEEDEAVPAEHRAQMERVLSQFARDYDTVSYVGEGRGFYCGDNAASEDAWRRTLRFLEEHLEV